MKDIDREYVSVLNLPPHDIARLLRRQLPRGARWKIAFEVREWEGAPWVAGYQYDHAEPFYWMHHQRNAIASAPLLHKPRRFERKLVWWGTLPPDLIAYLLLAV